MWWIVTRQSGDHYAVHTNIELCRTPEKCNFGYQFYHKKKKFLREHIISHNYLQLDSKLLSKVLNIYWFKSMQNDTNWGMPQYILARLGFDGSNTFDLDLIILKEFLNLTIFTEILIHSGRKGRQERQHQLSGLH